MRWHSLASCWERARRDHFVDLFPTVVGISVTPGLCVRLEFNGILLIPSLRLRGLRLSESIVMFEAYK